MYASQQIHVVLLGVDGKGIRGLHDPPRKGVKNKDANKVIFQNFPHVRGKKLWAVNIEDVHVAEATEGEGLLIQKFTGQGEPNGCMLICFAGETKPQSVT